MAQFYTVQGDFLQVHIKVIPGASKTAIAGIEGEQSNSSEETGKCMCKLKVKIAEQPEDGKANAALIKFLAKQLGCTKTEIVIKSGAKSRCKTVELPAAYKCKLDEI